MEGINVFITENNSPPLFLSVYLLLSFFLAVKDYFSTTVGIYCKVNAA